VRSYLLGSMLNMLDGPFNVSELVRSLITEGSTLEHFEQMVDCIRHISPAQLRDLAQKYLRRESMWEVVVTA
jgi:zinc protease